MNQPVSANPSPAPEKSTGRYLLLSLLPIGVLIASLIFIIITRGADSVNALGPYALLGAAVTALTVAACARRLNRRDLAEGLRRSARQVLPAIPLLALIALISTTWMLSGIVPAMIDYGLRVINPTFFLVTTCAICAVVSVMTGSSWTTIATIGVAFMGIGSVLGYSEGWIAGAIISGAYFGDKVSPLSDTTVIASSSCGVDLFDHIRYLMLTAVPAMSIALLVFLCEGLLRGTVDAAATPELVESLRNTFNISPWTLLVPALTCTLIALRVNTFITLGAAVIAGIACIFIAQPQIADNIVLAQALWSDTVFNTGNTTLDSLASTSGFLGMLPTIFLVSSALIFGSVMIGTGMIRTIAEAFTRRLTKRTHIVGATVAGGITLNCCTADQYLSIIIGSNMFREVYQRFGLEPRLLSRTVEDSTSVTSVLIPWNSCGVTQTSVLGVSTITYLPYCVFNYLSPLMSLAMAWSGYRIKRLVTA